MNIRQKNLFSKGNENSDYSINHNEKSNRVIINRDFRIESWAI